MKKIIVFTICAAALILYTGCKKSTDELPTASFTVSQQTAGTGETITFQNTSQNADSFEWDFGDGNGSTDKNPSHSYSDEGNYTVKLTASNSEGSDNVSKIILIQASNPCWSKLANLPKAMNLHMIAITNGKIYVAGGGVNIASFMVYDISGNSWEVLPDLPAGREFLDGCAINGKVYAIGGWDLDTTFNLVNEFDPSSGQWTTKSPMPTQRWGHAAIPVDGKIYIVGGCKDWPIAKYYSTIEIYDPVSDSWTRQNTDGTSALTSRWGFDACMVNNKIYVIGGVKVDDYPPSGQTVPSKDIVEVFDLNLNSWEQKTSMPTARWGLMTVVVNNKIYAIGGAELYEPTRFSKVVEEYDPITDTWVEKSAMPKGLISFAACEADNKIYIPGGGGLSALIAFRDLFIYDPVCDTAED